MRELAQRALSQQSARRDKVKGPWFGGAELGARWLRAPAATSDRRGRWAPCAAHRDNSDTPLPGCPIQKNAVRARLAVRWQTTAQRAATGELSRPGATAGAPHR